MAGGIDWFRWHHGSVSDQKFILVARRAGASVAEVIAVWACLLEAASAAEVRGCAGAVDHEAMDCALGMQDGRSMAIHQAMLARDLVTSDGCIHAWEKRQPKRERPDDNSTERSRAFRQKQRQETPSNATERTETPRGEESREELSSENLESVLAHTGEVMPEDQPQGHTPTLYGAISRAIRQAGISNANPSHQTFRLLVDAGATADEFVAHVPKALLKQGDRFAYVLGCVRGEREQAATLAGRIHQGVMPTAPATVASNAAAITQALLQQQEQRRAQSVGPPAELLAMRSRRKAHQVESAE